MAKGPPRSIFNREIRVPDDRPDREIRGPDELMLPHAILIAALEKSKKRQSTSRRLPRVCSPARKLIAFSTLCITQKSLHLVQPNSSLTQQPTKPATMKFPTLQPFHLEGMTIRILASSPVVQPLKQSVPGQSQSGSCSLSSTQTNGTNAAASTSACSTSNSLEGYMHGQPLPPLGLGSSDLQSKSHQVRSSFLSFCPFLFIPVPHCCIRCIVGMHVGLLVACSLAGTT